MNALTFRQLHLMDSMADQMYTYILLTSSSLEIVIAVFLHFNSEAFW